MIDVQHFSVSVMKTRKCENILIFAIVCVTLSSLFCAGIQQLMSLDNPAIYLRAHLFGESDWKSADRIKEELETLTHVPSCSLKWTVRQNSYLRNRFNFSVPVLQWAESFNQSEWQRLQYANLPYGWKDVSPKVVSSALSLLQNSSSSRLFERKSPDQCVHCAVVGNGGILNGSGQGKAIDSHDYVFRVNGAIIKGFEEDVGTKTSFYGFTTNSMKNSLAAYRTDGFTNVPQDPDITFIFIPAEIRDYVMLAAAIHGVPVSSGYDEGDQPSDYFGDKHSFKHFRMLHPYFIEYVTKRFLSSLSLKRYSDVYMPTTGAMMLLTALHVCDQVSAYGFITRNYKRFSDHYYDAVKKPLIFYSNHDMIKEGTLWDIFHSSRVMWLFQRDMAVPEM
ncbi:alpha-N-acetylgalactosaminide alpha-2,6-sialyltransferase 2-like isoform X1 [Brachyhypopomus gauderio]|uniref:alpha-N-acetylgalactosaminide alpha-2,6-sialyltransferase 2-like isoform X1 n=2 Tax=Brachyhypopomus gauderio TaxID=698409 RepID=UPI0040418A75